MSNDVSYGRKARALFEAAKYRPGLVAGAIGLSVVAALFEGIGVSFILPIVQLARGQVDPAQAEGVLGVFVGLYRWVGVPFTIGNLVVGVSVVMTIRYTTSFVVGWLRGAIETYYIQHLQREAFHHAMAAETEFFDQEGSDDILNAIVTQAEYAGQVLNRIVKTTEQGLLSMMYFSIALFFAPVLTLATLLMFGFLTVLFRRILESGYSLGDRIADANERIQEHAQAGTQGIREVKLFGLASELRTEFGRGLDQFTDAKVDYHRNQSAIENFYNLFTAVAMFVLIYVALTFSGLQLGELGVFLFAMFRLGPRISTLNHLIYSVDGDLPHVVRTQEFVDRLCERTEPRGRERPVPDPVDTVAFNDVQFAYEDADESVLDDVSFAVDRGEFVAFVGPSGAGKSTIVSLLAKLYYPDKGMITANDVPIRAFDVGEWRANVSVVRQDPHIFNDTLLGNVTVGDRTATHEEVERACEIACVTEFLDDLPDGYETELGDDGVRLSGGQRQRVAIARAILKDADLLVLDEATSDLDTSLEEEVHEGIESLDGDYAMIVIAHRLSTVTNADRIYTMESGRITEVGPHEKLVADDGTYAELYAMQVNS
jgi:subfamily B ATP-binding cassette protein MsbA